MASLPLRRTCLLSRTQKGIGECQPILFTALKSLDHNHIARYAA